MVNADFTISDLQKELGITSQELAARIGISRSRMSEVKGGMAVSMIVALKLEEISGGRINAAALNQDVARARAACGECSVHVAQDAPLRPAAQSAKKVNGRAAVEGVGT